jgi:polyphenol oxidase
MATWVGHDEHGVIFSRTTTRADGDFAIDADPEGLAARRRAVADHRWVWVRQVHGTAVVTVTADNVDQVTGVEADALVTAEPELVLAVQTADCVPVTFTSHAGVVGVAHAGWRGLEAGVIEATVAAMRDLGAGQVTPSIGPHIGPACYEFGPADLDRLADAFGPEVQATTSWGTPGLDLRRMVEVALYRAGAGGPPPPRPLGAHGQCTADDPDRWFSYRARAESERMATVIWRERSAEAAVGS